MRKYSYNQLAAGRGAWGVASALADERVGRVQIVDPKPAALERLGDHFRAHGAEVRAVLGRAEEADWLDEGLPIVHAADDLGSISTVLDATGDAVPLSLGQGVGTPSSLEAGHQPLGLRFAAVPERPDQVQAARSVMKLLAEITPPQSSSAIRSRSGLSAYRLARLRSAVSSATGSDLTNPAAVLDREHALELFTADDTVYPMELHRPASTNTSDLVTQAQDVAKRSSAIAFLRSGSRLDIVVIDIWRGRPLARAHYRFERPAPAPRPSIIQPVARRSRRVAWTD